MPSTYQSTVVSAPIEKVWDTVKDFHDFSWAPDVIKKCESEGEKSGTEEGAKRILNDVFHETLLVCDKKQHLIQYSIDDGPSPVSKDEVDNYIGTLHLLPVTEHNSTFVEWYSEWESSTDDAVDFCHNIYIGLLSSLEKHFP